MACRRSSRATLATARERSAAVRHHGEGASADVGGSAGGGGAGGGLTLLESVVVGPRTCRLVLRARGAGGCRWRQRQLRDRVRGCGARFARRWCQAANALARAVCSRRWWLLAEVAAATDAASVGGGGTCLARLGSHQGWPADALVCAACLRRWRCSSTSMRWRGGFRFTWLALGSGR